MGDTQTTSRGCRWHRTVAVQLRTSCRWLPPYASMTAEQQETLEKYDDCVNEMYGLIELEIFSYAFRLGGRLMLATLMDSGEDA